MNKTGAYLEKNKSPCTRQDRICNAAEEGGWSTARKLKPRVSSGSSQYAKARARAWGKEHQTGKRMKTDGFGARFSLSCRLQRGRTGGDIASDSREYGRFDRGDYADGARTVFGEDFNNRVRKWALKKKTESGRVVLHVCRRDGIGWCRLLAR